MRNSQKLDSCTYTGKSSCTSTSLTGETLSRSDETKGIFLATIYMYSVKKKKKRSDYKAVKSEGGSAALERLYGSRVNRHPSYWDLFISGIWTHSLLLTNTEPSVFYDIHLIINNLPLSVWKQSHRGACVNLPAHGGPPSPRCPPPDEPGSGRPQVTV